MERWERPVESVGMMEFDLSFYRGKRVFVTGHTGFKGSWLCVMLANAGAEVTGYSTCSERNPSLFDLCGVSRQIVHTRGDVRNLDGLLEAMGKCRPEIVIHMAAQPIVRESYRNPADTYAVNVMGTVNICEAARRVSGVKSILNVTTDKVYFNREWEWGYRENELLDGYDPYSNSKSCSELVTHAYANSFFRENRIAVSTARAGNVIGGGDFAKNRIIPDCVRAAVRGEPVTVRNPSSVRPYQHVLEPLYAYLMIAAGQYQNPGRASWYNVGPDERDCLPTGVLVDLFVKHWGEGLTWQSVPEAGPHEANLLKLDCSRLKAAFQWRPRWDLDTAVRKVVEWSKVWRDGGDVQPVMNRQIEQFLGGNC